MAVSPIDLTLYIASDDANNRPLIKAFAYANGSYTSSPSRRIGPSPLNNVTALAFDAQGFLYVGATQISPGNGAAYPNVVRVYDVSVTPAALVRLIPNAVPGTPRTITGLAISQPPDAAQAVPPPRLYVTQPSGGANSFGSVTAFPAAPTSDVLTPITTISGSSTGLRFPSKPALDSTKHIYVVNSDTNANTILAFAPGANGNASHVASIAGPATTLNNPDGIAIDASDNIYVSNDGNSSITV